MPSARAGLGHTLSFSVIRVRWWSSQHRHPTRPGLRHRTTHRPSSPWSQIPPGATGRHARKPRSGRRTGLLRWSYPWSRFPACQYLLFQCIKMTSCTTIGHSLKIWIRCDLGVLINWVQPQGAIPKVTRKSIEIFFSQRSCNMEPHQQTPHLRYRRGLLLHCGI